MREIKFRGKAIVSIGELKALGIDHDNGWVYGNLIKNGNRPIISADILEEIDESIYPKWWVVVEPKSIGQYTGLKDKNGREIYEGDIVETVTASGNSFGTIDVVRYQDGGFKLVDETNSLLPIYIGDKEIINIEVIGNIYENPDLLGRLIQVSKERLENMGPIG